MPFDLATRPYLQMPFFVICSSGETLAYGMSRCPVWRLGISIYRHFRHDIRILGFLKISGNLGDNFRKNIPFPGQIEYNRKNIQKCR